MQKQMIAITMRAARYALMTLGLSSLIGPLELSGFLSSFLNRLGMGLIWAGDAAQTLSERIRYADLAEAQEAIDIQTRAGAKVINMWNNGDRGVVLEWDTTDFQGEDIAVNCLLPTEYDYIEA